jgi:DNA-binding NtrC family response regulator
MNKPINFLVVDDDKQITDMLNEFLTGLGYSVTTAYGGKEALSEFSAGKYSVVIVDLKMPELDGMKVMESIKKKDPSTVVIMITGYGTIDSGVAAIRQGAYDFIAKPFSWDEFEIVIRRAVERHRSVQVIGFYKKLIRFAAVSIIVLIGLLLLKVISW